MGHVSMVANGYAAYAPHLSQLAITVSVIGGAIIFTIVFAIMESKGERQ